MGQRSLKVIENGAVRQTMYDCLLVSHCNHSSILYRFRVIRKPECGFLFAFFVAMAVSVAVCEIFSGKEWRDLENQIRCRSRSIKLEPFNRPYVTFYWSAIVNIALSCTIFELFDVE